MSERGASLLPFADTFGQRGTVRETRCSIYEIDADDGYKLEVQIPDDLGKRCAVRVHNEDSEDWFGVDLPHPHLRAFLVSVLNKLPATA